MSEAELHKEVALAAHHVLGRHGDCPCGRAGRLDCDEVADAVLALPEVVALLDAQAAVTRVQAAYENREAYQTPVALLAEIRRALVGAR